MKLKEYLERIEQLDRCDIEAFVKMSYEVAANVHNLHAASSSALTALLIEKTKAAARLLRAKECQTHSPTAVSSRMYN